MPEKAAETEPKKDLQTRVYDDLVKAGLPLEMHVTRLLEQDGWTVTNQVPYLDQDAQKTRTIDMVASNLFEIHPKAKPRFLALSLVVECKQSHEHPWVFFTRPKTAAALFAYAGAIGLLPAWEGLFQQLPASQEQKVAEAQEDVDRIIKLTAGLHYFWPEFQTAAVAHHTCFRLQQENSDLAYSAFRQVTKAVKFRKTEDKARLEKLMPDVLFVYYPLVVFDGNMFEVKETGAQPAVQPVDYLQYNVKESIAIHLDSSIEQFLVDVVTKAGLEAYLQMLHREADLQELRTPEPKAITQPLIQSVFDLFRARYGEQLGKWLGGSGE